MRFIRAMGIAALLASAASAQVPARIPGARSVTSCGPADAHYTLIHIRQMHTAGRPDSNDIPSAKVRAQVTASIEQKNKLALKVETNVIGIIDYFASKNITHTVYVEGDTSPATPNEALTLEWYNHLKSTLSDGIKVWEKEVIGYRPIDIAAARSRLTLRAGDEKTLHEEARRARSGDALDTMLNFRFREDYVINSFVKDAASGGERTATVMYGALHNFCGAAIDNGKVRVYTVTPALLTEPKKLSAR